MIKYIDAEKLIAEIERQKSLFSTEKEKEGLSKTDKLSLGARIASLEETIVLIDSLQQEQPSLPSNLDEAATQAANQMEIPTEHSQPESLTLVMRHIAFEMFKSGAEWMARQMKQEQPEVNLEEELDKFYGMYRKD